MSQLLTHQNWKSLFAYLKSKGKSIVLFDRENNIGYSANDILNLIDETKIFEDIKSINKITFSHIPQFSELIYLLAHLKYNKTLLLCHENDSYSISTHFEKTLNLTDQGGIFFKTSGTSGSPKYFYFTSEQILQTALIQKTYLNLTADETMGLTLPFYHVSGFMALVRGIMAGATMYLGPDLYQCVNHLSYVPTQIYKLINDQKLKKCSHKRTFLIGGQSLDETSKNFLSALGINILESFGATETLGFFALNEKVLPHIYFYLNKDKSPTLFGETLPNFYFQNSKMFLTQHHSLGITLNDIVHVYSKDEHWHLRFVSRGDLVFKSAGENINPLTIEESLSTIKRNEGVDILILPMAHHDYQLIPVALIISPTPLDNEKELALKKLITDTLKEQYSNFFLPKSFFFYVSSMHFEQKTGRSFYQKIMYQLFYQRILGLEIDYEEIESAKNITLTLHGFLGSTEEFKKLFNNINLEDHRLIHLVLPFHQLNSKDFESQVIFSSPEIYFSYLVHFIHTFLKTKNLTFFGYSMGGRILINLIPKLELNEKAQIILMSASLGLKTNQEKIQRLANDKNLIAQFQKIEEFLNFWYRQSLFGKDYDIEMEKRLSLDPQFLERKSFDLANLNKALQTFSIGNFQTSSELLIKLRENQKKILLPINLIVGELDQKYFNEYLELAKQHPNIFNLNVIKNTFHDPHRTDPTEIRTILKQILK